MTKRPSNRLTEGELRRLLIARRLNTLSAINALATHVGWSKRQRGAVVHAVTGLQDKVIAKRLGIKATTVRTHLRRAFAKVDFDLRVFSGMLLGLRRLPRLRVQA